MVPFTRWLKNLFGTGARRSPARRTVPTLEPLESRWTPALQLTYGGPGTELLLREVSAGDDTVTVSELGANRLRISLGGNTFAGGSATSPLFTYETGNPLTSHFVEVDHSAANTISTLAINTGAGSDTLVLGLANAAGGVGSVNVNGAGLATTLNSLRLPGGSLNVSGGPMRITPGATVVTNGGDLTLNGTGTASQVIGVEIDNALVNAGTGNLSITGIGGSSPAGDAFGVRIHGAAIVAGFTASVTGTGGAGGGNFNIGVHVLGAGTQVVSNGGAVFVAGSGGGSDAASGAVGNIGVAVQGGVVTAGGTGSVTVLGQGGRGTSAFGVWVVGAGGQITSSGGAVQVTGFGGGSAAASENYGVLVVSGGVVTAGGLGSVGVVGTGGNTDGNLNRGVLVAASARITSSGGPVQVSGSAGSGTNSDGIFVAADSVISSGGSGTLILNGTAPAVSGNAGIRISGGRVTAGGGDASKSLGLTPNSALVVTLSAERGVTSGYAFVHVDGTVDLGGAALQVNLADALPGGAAFALLNNDGATDLNGAFSPGLTFNGRTFALHQAGNGNDLLLTALPRVTISPITEAITTETGGSAAFRVELDTAPAANVTITFTSSNPAAGAFPGSLTFTPANWNVAQTFTVTGTNDNVNDGDTVYTLSTAVRSDDLLYAASNPEDIEITNRTVHLETDTTRTSKLALVVPGTANDDVISIQPGRAAGTVTVTVNGVSFGTFRPTGRIIVEGGAGNDRIEVGRRVRQSAWLSGGDGDDVLIGGAGADVLRGGAGDDQLFGNGGRDWLIGGAAADVLTGGGADDLLIGGTTLYDQNSSALFAVFAEWTSPRALPVRTANLRDGGGSPNRLNGNLFLREGLDVLDDGSSDTLSNENLGRDWLFSNS